MFSQQPFPGSMRFVIEFLFILHKNSIVALSQHSRKQSFKTYTRVAVEKLDDYSKRCLCILPLIFVHTWK